MTASAMPSSAAVAASAGRLGVLLRQLQEVAQIQESGSADAPLTRLVSRLLEGGEDHLLTVVVLGLDEPSRQAALAALLSEEARYPLCQVIVPPRVAFLEVQLHEQGFVVDDGRERRQFGEAESFLKALTQGAWLQAAAADNLMQPLRLTLTAAQGCAGLCLLLPENLEVLRRRPELLSLLTDRADIVLLCGAADAGLTEADREILATFATAVPALQHVVVLPEGRAIAPSAALPPWTRGSSFQVVLPPVWLAGETTSAPLLTTTGDPQRTAGLRLLRTLRDAETTLRLLEATAQREHHSATGKKRYYESTQQSATQADDGRLRNAQEMAQAEVAATLRGTLQATDDAIRRFLSPQGMLHQGVASALEAFSVGDLAHQDEEEKTLLSLKPPSLDALRTQVREAVLRLIQEQTRSLQDAAAAAATRAAQRIEPVTGQPVRLNAPACDNTRLLANLDPLFQAPIKYRGEVPRLTRGRMLMSIFQAPMILGTVTMLLQPLGVLDQFQGDPSKRHIWMAIQFVRLSVFILIFYMPFYTKKRIERERASALRRELERVRDGVSGELERIACRALDEFKRHASDHANAVGQALSKEVDHALRNVGARLQEETRNRQKLNTSQLQGLDRQIRELQARQQLCHRLGGDLASARSAAVADLRRCMAIDTKDGAG